jgi:integrase
MNKNLSCVSILAQKKDMPKQKTESYPIHIVSRWGKVHIYKNVNRDKWTVYVVAWSVGKRRQRMSFSDEAAAHAHAALVQEQFSKGEPLAAKVTSQKALYYEACEQKLNGVSLMDAVDYYLLHHGGVSKAATSESTEKLVEKYLKNLETSGNRNRDIQTVRSHLTRFKNAMKVPLSAIRAVDIDKYLQEPKDWSNRTRNNHKISITRLFNWAIQKDFLPSTLANPAEKATTYKVESSGSPGIFTPAELQTLFDNVEPAWMPYLAICAFIGTRSAEATAIEWSDIDFSEKVIVLDARHTKTKRRRVAHMPQNLVEWLQSYEGKKEGPVCPAKSSNNMTSRLSKKAKMTWVHNGLRHSYVSYQMAILRDAAKVAEQCGNSPQQVQENYKANALESDAKKWFEIKPKK